MPLHIKGVRALATGAFENVGAACAHPAVASALGLLLGLMLAVVSRAASRLMTPVNPAAGFARVALAAGARTLVTFAAMLVYFIYAPDGFLAFSVTAVVTFILSLAYEAFRASYPLPSSHIG